MEFLQNIKNDLQKYVAAHFPAGYKVTLSGSGDLQLEVNVLVISSQITSILISLVIVFLVLTIYYRAVAAGILGLITLAVPIFINFGIMGLSGIHLDTGTAIVAAVAIGIGIDYTIHFLNGYHHERLLDTDTGRVTARTINKVGQAILYNAFTVGVGFAVLMFSNFVPLSNLGLLILITMFTASFAALTLLPVLINIFKPQFLEKNLKLQRSHL